MFRRRKRGATRNCIQSVFSEEPETLESNLTLIANLLILCPRNTGPLPRVQIMFKSEFHEVLVI